MYGKYFCLKLSAEQNTSILIPAGFSHGTYSLEDDTVMLSICSGPYMPEKEGGFSMASLRLPFYKDSAITSDKDIMLPNFSL